MTTNESKRENISSSDNRTAKPDCTKTRTDASAGRGASKRNAWLDIFCQARFEPLRQSLSPENQGKWDALSYGKKCFVVQSMISKGCIT